MTTILADARLGVMVSDSSISDGNRVWAGRKVFRHKGSLLGFAGDINEAIPFLEWWRGGCQGKPPKFSGSQALVLSEKGLLSFHVSCTPQIMKGGIEAIGSGSKAAMCAYDALGHKDPAQAVAIVCNHDSGSRKPVRTYRV